MDSGIVWFFNFLYVKLRNLKPRDKLYKVNDREGLYVGVASENGIYGHSRFCNTDFDDKLACLNLSGV